MPDLEFFPSAGPGPRAVRGSRDPVSLLLAGIVLPLVLATLVGLVLLWPHGPAGSVRGSAVASAYDGVTFVPGRVVAVTHRQCPGDSTDRGPDGTVPVTAVCTSAQVRLTGGPQSGHEVSVSISPQINQSGIHPGDLLDLAHYPRQAGVPDVYAFVDFARGVPLALLAGCFALLVIAVGRWRGLAALAGLALAFAGLVFFFLPALRRGENPVLVSAVGATAIMVAILYLVHGPSRKTTTALIGTVFGIWLSVGLAAGVTSAVHLNGLDSEESFSLQQLLPGPDLRGLILCGIVLAGLGVLNDVTITQASAVWELREQAPQLPAVDLFRSGMRIGRDHLASTVYTLAFAYAGAALPALLLIDISGEPLAQMLTGAAVAEELVRTLIGSIGLLLAIPVTTAVAALVVAAGGRPGPEASEPVSAPVAGEVQALPVAPAADEPLPRPRQRPQPGPWPEPEPAGPVRAVPARGAGGRARSAGDWSQLPPPHLHGWPQPAGWWDEPGRPPVPVPGPQPGWEPEPELVRMAEPEPVPMAEPEPVRMAEPEPVRMAEPEPEPVRAAEPAPVWVMEPRSRQAEPDPARALDDDWTAPRGLRIPTRPPAVIDLTEPPRRGRHA